MTTFPVKRQLNFSIELLRIICSIMVIAIHTVMNFRVVDGVIAYDVLFFETFLRSSVPVFFMITGFLIFKSKKSSSALLKQLFFKVVIPTLIMLLLLQWFDGFLNSKSSFLDNLLSLRIDFEDLFYHISNYSSNSKNGFYLWYVFSLIFVYLWIPLLRFICIDEVKANRTRHALEWLCFISTIIVPTLLAIFPKWWPIHIPTVLPDQYLLYFLLGFEFRLLFDKNPNFFKQKKTKIISLGVYIIASLVGILFAVNFDIAVNKELLSIFYRYEMLNVFVQSLALFTLFLGISIKNETIKKVIKFTGNKCFYIYLVHWPIMLKFLSNGSAGRWQESLGFIFYPLFIFGVFLASLLVATIIHSFLSFLTKRRQY